MQRFRENMSWLLLILLVGMIGYLIFQDSPEELEMPALVPHLDGRVEQVINNRGIQFKAFPDEHNDYPEAFVGIDIDTKIYRFDGVLSLIEFSEIHADQHVHIWLTGPRQTSNPVQVTASHIVIIGN